MDWICVANTGVNELGREYTSTLRNPKGLYLALLAQVVMLPDRTYDMSTYKATRPIPD